LENPPTTEEAMTGKDILAERKRRGIAQTTLAKAAGVDLTVISAIERGKLQIAPAELLRLWGILDSIKPQDQTHNAA